MVIISVLLLVAVISFMVAINIGFHEINDLGTDIYLLEGSIKFMREERLADKKRSSEIIKDLGDAIEDVRKSTHITDEYLDEKVDILCAKLKDLTDYLELDYQLFYEKRTYVKKKK